MFQNSSSGSGWGFCHHNTYLDLYWRGVADHDSNLSCGQDTWYIVGVTFDDSADSATYYRYTIGTGVLSTHTVAVTGNPSGSNGTYTVSKADFTVLYSQISEVKVWSIALTDAEMRNQILSLVKHYANQAQPSSLELYLPLDDNPIQTGINNLIFRDLSGNGRNGTGVDADGDSAVVGESILSYPPKIGNSD
jgi:hypothetical protein